jgi:hypothetical protein
VQTISGTGTLVIGTGCDVTIGAASNTILNKDLSTGKDIQVLPGGKLTVSPGITLTVNGETVIN